jgi:hypothetical protein
MASDFGGDGGAAQSPSVLALGVDPSQQPLSTMPPQHV